MGETFRTTVISSTRTGAIATAEKRARDWFGTDDVLVRMVSASPHAVWLDGRVEAYEADFECTSRRERR